MPIDVAKVLGASLPATRFTWDADRVILYHLGIGAGNPPTAEGELSYTYEGNLKVLPTFAAVPALPAVAGVLAVDGLDVNVALLLHSEQDLELEKPLPTSGTVTTRGTLAAVYDKGKAAVVVVEVRASDDTGQEVFVARSSLFLRGEGGFGGPSAPPPDNDPPARAPDLVVHSQTLPQQALLYRLSGDKNPLHADPAFAALAGYDRPILHGLCTYGIVGKAVVDHALSGEVGRVRRYRARFSGVVFPGETIVTRMWEANDRWVVAATTQEREAPVVSNAAVWIS